MAVRLNTTRGSGLRGAILLLWLPMAADLAAAGELLAPGLRIDPPENLVIRHETLEVLNGRGSLVGYVEGAPAYFIGAETIANPARNRVLWGRLETSLREKSDTHTFTLAATGDFQTHRGAPVWYRVYQYPRKGKPQAQVFYLMKLGHSAFWIYATAVESVDLQSIIPMVNTLLRRAELSEAHP